MGRTHWAPPRGPFPIRESRERGCHLHACIPWQPFTLGSRQWTGTGLQKLFLPQLVGTLEASRAEEAGVGLFLLSSLSLLPSPCFLLAGPHPCPLPARLQQQPLVHNVIHALLTSTPTPSQRHAAISSPPFPTVHQAAEDLQPARYLSA